MASKIKPNDVYGNLKVIKRIGQKKNGTTIWECECLLCGNHKDISSDHFCSGATTSCGCYRKEYRRKQAKRYNSFNIQGDITIATDQQGNTFMFDTADLDLVKKYYWSVTKRGYVRSSYLKMTLHRYLLQPSDDMVVDHKNHVTTDNRRCNIWECTQSDNMYNQKRFHC